MTSHTTVLPIREDAGLRRAEAYWLVHFVVLAIVLAPLLSVAYIPLVDLPNHLARQEIIARIGHSPTLAQFYTVDWAIVPNLALELFVKATAWAMPIPLAVKSFCLLTAAGLYLGTCFLHWRLYQTLSLVPAFAGLFIYSGPFQMGFVNYLFSIAVALFALGLWVGWRAQTVQAYVWRTTVATTLLFFLHLYAFGMFALSVFGIELAGAIEAARASAPGTRRRRFAAAFGDSILRNALPALLPLLLFLMLSPTAAGTADTIPSNLWYKRNSLESLFAFEHTRAEYLYGGAIAALILGMIALGILRTQRVLVPTLILFGIVYLAMPLQLLGSYYADYRMPAAIILFAIAFCDWRPGRGAAPAFAATAIAMLLVGVRSEQIVASWQRWQPSYESALKIFEQIPAGSKILPLNGPDEGFQGGPLTHLVTLAAPIRDAFVPTLFADEPGQILHIAPNAQPIRFPDLTPQIVRVLYTYDYDYVWVTFPERMRRFLAMMPLEETARGPNFALYRIDKSR